MTSHTDELLKMLSKDVRTFSLGQIERTWTSRAGARRWISNLERDGSVEVQEHLARPELDLTGPELVWTRGCHDIPFGRIAHKLKSRWSEPIRPTCFVLPTKKTLKEFGGPPSYKLRATDYTHDLHVSTILLFLRSRQEHQEWVSERELRAEEKGIGDFPDAVLRNGDGQISKAIDFGGSYAKSKLTTIHREWSSKFPSYEIW